MNEMNNFTVFFSYNLHLSFADCGVLFLMGYFLPANISKVCILKAARRVLQKICFLENITRCPKLEYVYLDLDQMIDNIDDTRSLELVQMNAKVEIVLHLDFYDDKDAIGDDLFKIKAIDVLREKIKSVQFFTRIRWNRHFTSAMLLFVDRCPYMTAFSATIYQTRDQEYSTEESMQELKQAKLALIPLFADGVRAMNFRLLEFNGQYDISFWNAIFENCLNVQEFSVIDCPDITDEHFIGWRRRGVRLTKLTVLDRINEMVLNDDSIIPVLMSVR